VVCYPAIAEEDETHLIETPLETRLVTRSRGEALHPERQPVAILAARSANIILPASTNRCCRPRAAAWSRRRGSRATNERSDKFDQLGHRQQRLRAQRFQRLHQLGIKGKNLYLLNVLRKQMKYPEPKNVRCASSTRPSRPVSYCSRTKPRTPS